MNSFHIALDFMNTQYINTFMKYLLIQSIAFSQTANLSHKAFYYLLFDPKMMTKAINASVCILFTKLHFRGQCHVGIHCSDVIMSDGVSNHQPHDLPFNQTQIKENFKAQSHWPMCGEFIGQR